MTDFIHLIGAEDVSNAGRNISSAASDMQRAAGSIDETFRNFQNFLEEWLIDFKEIVEKTHQT